MLVEATAKSRKATLMRYAPNVVLDKKTGRRLSATARCQGCGKEISTADVPADLQWVVTKRGTAVFFHEKCADRVWERKIPT